MTPILFNAPTDVASWLTFGSVHQSDHFAISQQIIRRLQLPALMLPIDPVPLDHPEHMVTWFQNHQAIHNAMNASLGLAGSDLSSVNFRDQTQLVYWMQYNALEHMAVAQALVGLPVPSLPTPAGVVQLQAQQPLLPGDNIA